MTTIQWATGGLRVVENITESECFMTFSIIMTLVPFMVSSHWIIVYVCKLMLLFPVCRQWAGWCPLSSPCILQMLWFWEESTHIEMPPGVMANCYIWIQVNVKVKTQDSLLHLTEMLGFSYDESRSKPILFWSDAFMLWPLTPLTHLANMDCSVWLMSLHVRCTSILSSLSSSPPPSTS